MAYASQAQFGNYDPSSFGWPRNADLVPFKFNGVNFGLCARDALPVFVAVLTELVPHIKGGLKAGSCWAYAATDDLPDGSWSFHHYGTAMDINWNVNHMGTNIPDATGEYAIPRDVATAVARKYGCEWGGNWLGGFHDNMHIEIHLTPAQARAVKSTATGGLTVSDVSDLKTAVADVERLVRLIITGRGDDPKTPGNERIEGLAQISARLKALESKAGI